MFVLAVTDPRWHKFLLDHPQAEPLNFWTPTPWKPRIAGGTTFGFMVKSPYRKIGGYGRFSRYEEHPIDVAWQRFRTANGVADEDTFRTRIKEYAARRSSAFIDTPDPTIGCILLDDCVFLPEDQMVAPSELGISFPDQIVKWKGFDGDLRLPEAIGLVIEEGTFELVDPEGTTWESRMAKKRVSQAAFRDRILSAYGGRCAVSGETCTTILDAAHIQPFFSLASNHVQNGICLRVDVHRLFDAGLIAINDNYDVMVSPLVDSSMVRALHSQRIHTPNDPSLQPSLKALDFHRTKIFRA